MKLVEQERGVLALTLVRFELTLKESFPNIQPSAEEFFDGNQSLLDAYECMCFTQWHGEPDRMLARYKCVS